MNVKQKTLLATLDSIIAPSGFFDQSAYDFFLDKNAELLSLMTEPDITEDEDEWNSWNESTLKHQIFDFMKSQRPRILNKPYLQTYNDLPWAIVTMVKAYVDMDKEVDKQIAEWYNQ